MTHSRCKSSYLVQRPRWWWLSGLAVEEEAVITWIVCSEVWKSVDQTLVCSSQQESVLLQTPRGTRRRQSSLQFLSSLSLYSSDEQFQLVLVYCWHTCVLVKVKRYSFSWQVISELRGVTYHTVGSHSVTFHPTQVKSPRLTPAREAGTRFTYPEGWKAELT